MFATVILLYVVNFGSISIDSIPIPFILKILFPVPISVSNCL